MPTARQLWLLRHADAEPHGTRPDAERRLTERGRRQAEAAGHALRELGVSFGAALSSPKTRAHETADLALGRLGASQAPPLSLHGPLAEGFRAEQAFEALAEAERAGPVLLVGHEPDLSGVVAELTGARVDLKKGGLAVVRLDGGSGELVLLLRPAELALIAGVAPVEG